MADITNPEAVRFSNEKIRTLADLATRYYYAAKSVANEWGATGMNTKIPSTSDLIADGSDVDGRSPITGANINGLIGHAEEMIADLEANGNQRLNILLQIEVNGSN